MSKYEPLTAFLSDARTEEVPMSFDEIERVIGTPLPASKQYAAWWSNNPSNNVMTRAWLKAGFRTERVDTVGERLVFRRSGPPVSESREMPVPLSSAEGFLAGIRRRLGGAITIAPGVDLTAPTGEIWDAER